ncbi:MAG: HEAT repeat domain-containing protein [Planctomycetota bacterium]|nr:HEAT repeat domain-containing protein [Planctomycetota bacterium]
MKSQAPSVPKILGVLAIWVGMNLTGTASVATADTTWSQSELTRGYVVFPHTPLQVLLSGRKPAPGNSPEAVSINARRRVYIHRDEGRPYGGPMIPPDGIGPEFVPERAAIVTTVSCELARGEYRSVQIGIHALADNVRQLKLEVDSDLTSRVYRGIDAKTRDMLHDYPNPVWPHLHDVCLDESAMIDVVEKQTTAFFWITMHADKSTAAGSHCGKIRLHAADGPVTELDLDVIVHPFELQRARIAYAPFYYAEWGRETGIPEFAQTDEWIAAILRDLAEHSHNSLVGMGYGVPGSAIDFSTIPPAGNRTFSFLLPLAQQIGLTTPEIPVIHFGHNLKQLPEKEGDLTLDQQEKALQWYESERKKHDWPELIAYGHDEPPYPNPELRRRYAPLRGIFLLTGTAMFAPAVYGLGDVHDVWIVRSGEITQEMCAEAKRQGAEMWTYHCDAMSFQPLWERHYAGFYVWAYQLRGHTTWHYYAQEKFKLVWMRETDKRPMPTSGWEMRREGIDDYRYLQMLEDAIAARPKESAAVEARAWLADLRARILANDRHIPSNPSDPLPWQEYDRVRARAARYLQQLGPVTNDQVAPVVSGRRKDEAKPFRAKSLSDCLAGLDSAQESDRRAAAWALCERGSEAAPGVGRLVELLKDDATRLPAMRALEAIGPSARSALPALQQLTDHPDGFVRLGASIAAKAIDADS